MSFTQFSMVEELASLVKDNLHCKHLVLSVEEALLNLLQDETSSDAVLELEPMNSYNRLLIHRLADIFGFSHHSVGEGDDRHIVLQRCPDSSIPSMLVIDLLWEYDDRYARLPDVQAKPSESSTEDEEDIVDLTQTTGVNVEGAIQPSKKRLALVDLVQKRRKEAKRTQASGPTPETEDNQTSSQEECAAMENKVLSFAFRQSNRWTQVLAREAMRRLAAPVESEEEYKKQIYKLNETIIAKNVVIARQEVLAGEHYKKRLDAESELKEVKGELSKVKEEFAKMKEEFAKTNDELQVRDETLIDLKTQFDKLRQEFDSLSIETTKILEERDALKVDVVKFPSRVEVEKKEAILQYRKSAELDEDLQVILRAAMSGGFTFAVDQVKALEPNLDLSKLTMPRLYNPSASDLYDQYSKEFQHGESLVEKYGSSTPAAEEPTPTPDATS